MVACVLRLNSSRELERVNGYLSLQDAWAKELHTLFWDINLLEFNPMAYPDYTIFRVLEYGDTDAVEWLQQQFSEGEIRRVLRTERRLTPKSANYWRLVYDIPIDEVAALKAESPLSIRP